MTISAPPPGLQPEDFEEIETAVMETARGRWFLDEYARRVRRAEGEALLAAIARLEARLESRGALAPDETFNVAERLSELSWTLRERGVEDFVCGKIDALAREFSGGAKVPPRRKVEARPAAAAEAPPSARKEEAVSAAPIVADDDLARSSDHAAQSEAQPALRQPAQTTPAAPAPTLGVASTRAPEPAPASDDATPQTPPPPPIDPRLAALSWLDRLPLVDRMALFA